MSGPKIISSDEGSGEPHFRIVETPPSSVNTPVLSKRRAGTHMPPSLEVDGVDGPACLSPTSNCSGVACDSTLPNYKSPPPLPLQHEPTCNGTMLQSSDPSSHTDEAAAHGVSYPASILKRAKGSGLSPNSSFFAHRVPSDLTNSFNLNTGYTMSSLNQANTCSDRLRTGSTNAATFEDSCELNIHRVSSAVRFQLPLDPSSPTSMPLLASPSQQDPPTVVSLNSNGLRDSNASTNTTNSTTRTSSHTSNDTPGCKLGPVGMIMSLLRSPPKQTVESLIRPVDSKTEYVLSAEGSLAREDAVKDGNCKAELVCSEISVPCQTDEKNIETDIILHSFATDGYDSDKSRAGSKAAVVTYGSPKRFDGSASPMGSFYFDGNHQVYIPDAPEDIMDIPSNQSFVGGGSFCSSPVVFSKKLKTVDVGQNLQVLNDSYIVYMDKLIGSGSFGEVHLCYSIDEEIYYAVKILNRKRLERMGIGTGNNAMEKLLNEIAIMQTLRHENIIALKEVINDNGANLVYLILELAGYGPLLNLKDGFVEPDCEGNSRIQETTVQDLVHSMVQALVYAHDLGVAHRDIKPDNVLLTNDSQLKVSDFGVSCLVDKQRTLDREGSIAFLPPEMLLPITKEKFIAPSPHVSAMGAGFSDAMDDEGVFGRLVPDGLTRVDSRGRYEMAPLSVDTGGSFSTTSHPTLAPGLFSSSANPHVNPEGDSLHEGYLSPGIRPMSGQGHALADVPNKVVSPTAPNSGTPHHHDVLSPASPNPSTHRARYRNDFAPCREDSFSSPFNGSLIRSPKVGWRHVNRNEIDLFKADVWALGVTAYVMLHGRLPWLAHLDLLQKPDGSAIGDIHLDEENNISERLDPQSRFRLNLYQRCKARKEKSGAESHVEEASSQSYLSPYRLANASFSRPKGESVPLASTSNDDIFCSILTNPPKEDKQNVEFAFWKYWTSLVHDSHLGQHTPSAATEKQLQAILCNPDPVSLLHSKKEDSDQRVDWDVFDSSDEDDDGFLAPRKESSPFRNPSSSRRGNTLAPLNISDDSPQLGSDDSTGSGCFGKARTRSIKITDDVDLYLAKQQSKFGEPLGRCESCSEFANNFIKECLQLDPVVRPTMKELLQHPWLATVRANYESKLKASESIFVGIPVVTECNTVEKPAGCVASPPIGSTPPPKSPTSRAVPTQTSARPIAVEERASLPTKLPELLASGQLAFRGLQPRRAVDDSVLIQVRKWRVNLGSPATKTQNSVDSVTEGTCQLKDKEVKKVCLRRPMSVPARIDEIDSFCLDDSDRLMTSSSRPIINRKRTMTLAANSQAREEK